MSVVQLQGWGRWEAGSSQAQLFIARAPWGSSSQGQGAESSLPLLAGGQCGPSPLPQQTALSVTSGASSLQVGLPASLQLTQEGGSEDSRKCLLYPGVSQLVLEPWLDQKWQLCHHSRA